MGRNPSAKAAATMLIDHYNNDTLGSRTDSLRWVWQQVRTNGARYAEALTYMEQGRLDSAALLIDGLNVDYEFQPYEAEERDRMLGLIDLWREFFSGTRNEVQLDSNEVQVLSDLMGQAYDRPANLISNLLCMMYGDCRPPMTGGDVQGELKRLPYTPLPVVWEHLAPTISLKPNPASTWVAIDYKLDFSMEDVTLLIQDAQGREVYRQKLSRSEDQIVWDSRGVAQGHYVVIISYGKGQLKSEQLIIGR